MEALTEKEKEELAFLRAEAAKKLEARKAKVAAGGARRMTDTERYIIRNKIFIEYVNAPKDKKPTRKDMSKKYNVTYHVMTKWYKGWGFKGGRRGL